MLPPHIAECTLLDSSTHHDHTARLSFEWEEVKMEDVQVAAVAYYFISAYKNTNTNSLLQSDIVNN
jgi:hypothetical protein